MACCILILTLIGWSAAVSAGILHQARGPAPCPSRPRAHLSPRVRRRCGRSRRTRRSCGPSASRASTTLPRRLPAPTRASFSLIGAHRLPRPARAHPSPPSLQAQPAQPPGASTSARGLGCGAAQL
eukprot:4174149-Prymnesium_polylepis.1